MSLKKIWPITLLFVLIIFSCKKKNITPDNFFKFRDYISYTTSGLTSVYSPIKISLANDVEGWETDKDISDDIISVSPHLEGSLKATNKHTFIFTPDEPLEPDTEYTVSVKIDKLYKKVPESFRTFTFQFKTIKQNFTIIDKSLQSYDKHWLFMNAVMKSADYIKLEDAKKLISASQENRSLPIVFDESYKLAKEFHFKIDSIKRQINDSPFIVSWDGAPINIDNKGKRELLAPGINNFSIISLKTEQYPEQCLLLNFSSPLKKQQNFDGLVSIENVKSSNFLVDGNVLKIYPKTKLVGDIQVDVFQGIMNQEGSKLKEPFSERVSFTQIKPQVKLINSGSILPNSNALNFNFEAVNLKAVDVRIIKIFEDNILQFLQDNDINGDYNIRRVGRLIAKKTITLIEDKTQNTGQWKAYSIDLSNYFKAEPGAIYRVELSYDKSYSLYNCGDNTNNNDKSSDFNDNFDDFNVNDDLREEAYWDNLNYSYKDYHYNWKERNNPCHEAYYNENRIVSQNLLASNLGVIVKKGSNSSYLFIASNILNTQPEANATVTLYNYQQQEIAKQKTNNKGFAKINTKKHAAFAIISKGKNNTYVKLDDGNSLSLSKFDVSGKKVQRGIKGYIYGERGVWRPGDTLHLTFILNDKANLLPKNHPVKMEITDPYGKLIYKQISTDHLNKVYKFTIPTSTEYKTGTYYATVSVGGAKFHKNLKIETVKPNRLKINMDFGDQTLIHNKPLNGVLKVNWLHGAAGKHLKAEVKAKFSPSNKGFKGYDNYIFQDPTRDFETEELLLFEGKLDENGTTKVNKSLEIGKNAPGLLNAQFLVRAFENGGDFSIDAFTKTYAAYDAFVGLKSPKENAYGSYFTDENQPFEVVLLSPNGTPIKRKGLQVKIYKIEWRWWWDSSYDNLSTYMSSSYHRPYLEKTIDTDNKGKGFFNIKIPEQDRGRYLIRVIDPLSGHATGRTAYFFKNWWETSPQNEKDAAKMLVFSSDKKQYNVGETAKITFPSGSKGRALISVENGTEVVDYKWVKTNKGQTTVNVPITASMAPNVFINISLLQPHAITTNDLPIRLYGVIPITVENPKTKLTPIIKMPETLQPKQEFNISISEANKKPMTYTIAIVEEGLLDLTRFKTPNAWNAFYSREALGVKTWDIYDDVVGAYSGSIEQVFAIGGDGNALEGKNKKANRFKPVVSYLGPFELKAGQTRSHKISLPNYIGAVRTMVVASDYKTEAYGSSEKSVEVKKPLMVLASLPRKLSPKEKVTLPVTIFAMENKIKNVNVSLKLSNGISVIGSSTKTINFTKPDEKMVYFELDATKAKGLNTIEVIATANGERSSHQIELDVKNPNPITSKSLDFTLSPNEQKTLSFSTFGISGSNTATVEFSTIPQIDFSRRIQFLIQYPHGCVEQTTSGLFPQLFLTDIFDLTLNQKQEIQKNIEEGITRLAHFQLPNGGLSYWIGETTPNDWGTSFAGHFMLEAEKKGYALPLMFKNNWLRYQKQAARNWSPNTSNDLAQAYRLYTLALAGEPDLASMNRLREFTDLSNDAKWRLAAAYAMAGQPEASKALSQKANIEFTDKINDYYTYGSATRNKAMALETMILTKNPDTRELAESLAKTLSSNTWMSTQTTSYSLLAIAKLIEANGGKALNVTYTLNGNKTSIKTSKSIAQRTLDINNGKNSLVCNNNSNNIIYARVLNSGKLPLGEELTEQRGLSIFVSYKDLNGKPINISKLNQGQDFIATVKVFNLKRNSINDIALTQIFPSGWEIINTRFTDYGNNTSNEARHIDIRDDRVNFYFDLDSNSTKTFNIMLNASYLGTYYLPGIQAEAMYDNDYLVRTKGQWISIEKQ